MLAVRDHLSDAETTALSAFSSGHSEVVVSRRDHFASLGRRTRYAALDSPGEVPMPDSRVMATVGEIAHRLGQPVHRIEYLIRSRRIKPAARAGNARIFSESDVERIAREVAGLRRRGR